MKKEIYRNYPIGDKVKLVERLLERNVLTSSHANGKATSNQPGSCCDIGCSKPGQAIMKRLE